jgi:para-nitrobenzyl esterase
MALEWVQENIESFGGDRRRVFLHGESAGAGSVAAHTVMPLSFPHYSRAGMQSGGFSVWDAHGLNTSQQTFDQLAKLLCPTAYSLTNRSDDPEVSRPLLRCLQAQDTASVAIMAQLLPKPCNPEFCCKWAPVVDGVELADHPYRLAAAGRRANVPILLGSNRDEDQSFIGQTLDWNLTAGDWPHWAADLYNFTEPKAQELAEVLAHPLLLAA